jgi:hypothetical protein
MRANADSLLEIPCFKCLFWDRKRESHLYCNPGECEKLTEWLLDQTRKFEEMAEPLTFVDKQPIEVTRKQNRGLNTEK